MGAVRLGKIALRWCGQCNLPVVERPACGTCGGETEYVKITPPGDVRPAFPHDLEIIRATVDSQFGEGCGAEMLPVDRVVLLNKCPGVDRMDEVIVDGRVVGSHVHSPGNGWSFVIRTEGAHFIRAKATKSWLIVDDGAIPSMRKGSSAMAVGVLDADRDIKVGDEIIVFDKERTVIATGRAKMTGSQMVEADRGPAIKNRWHDDPSELVRPKGGQTWESAVKANVPKIEENMARAAEHIKRTIERVGKPPAVSFSGGKDSLATLLLVLDAGIRPKVIFVDTGIEFGETLAHVYETVDKYDLELMIEKAGEAYFDALAHFGPSAKDFRWCCKTCKLGPTARLVRKHFPDGVLAFIGQRQYESENRYQKGGIWENPWVPGQIGASPIQKWTSLEVWLYIFYKKADYNPLYERGFERIGCWLCPAADMAEHEEIGKYMPRAEEWVAYLEKYAKTHNLPDEFVTMGLWRWRKLPKGMTDYLQAEGRPEVIARLREFEHSPRPEIQIPPEMEERVSRLSCITGGKHSQSVEKKALFCVGCGVCISRCEFDALEMVDGKINVDPDLCQSCGKCLHPCVVIDYPSRG